MSKRLSQNLVQVCCNNIIGPNFDSNKGNVCLLFLQIFWNISFFLHKEEYFWKKKTKTPWTKFWLKKWLFLDQVLTLYIYTYIYLSLSPGELAQHPPLSQNRVSPLSTWELAHYPRRFRPTNIGVWGPLFVSERTSASSGIMCVSALVFLKSEWLSCTRLRVPPVALHVSRYTCRSWFPGFYSVLQV